MALPRWRRVVPIGLLLAAIGSGSLHTYAVDNPPPATQLVGNERTIEGAPLHIGVREGLAVAVERAGAAQFFANFDSGTFVAVDGQTVYGPQPTGNNGFAPVAYTPVAHNGPGGLGTASQPFTITTVALLGTSGVTLTQTTSYITGELRYRTDMTLHNGSALTRTLRVIHAADFYVNVPNAAPDRGYGLYDPRSGAVGVRADDGSSVQVFVPLQQSPPDAYQEARWSADAATGAPAFWQRIGGAGGLPGPGLNSTVDTTRHDAAAGLQWQRTLAPGASVTLSDLIAFGPAPAVGVGWGVYLPAVRR